MARRASTAIGMLCTALFLTTPGMPLAGTQVAVPARHASPLLAPNTGVDTVVIRAYLAEQAALSQKLGSVTEQKAALQRGLASEQQAESNAIAKAADEKKQASQARYDQCKIRQSQCVQSCDAEDGNRRIGSALSSLGGRSASTAAGIAMLGSLSTAESCKQSCEATSCGTP